MPSVFKLLAPFSVLIGLIVAGAAIWFLWPIPPASMATIGLAAFLVAAGLCEVVTRSVRGGAKKGEP